MVENQDRYGWVEVPKPGGWTLVLDEKLWEPRHQLYQKGVPFELGKDINNATLGVHVEDGHRISKIDFAFYNGQDYIETAEFHFSEGFLIAPLNLKAPLREEFKKKVGSLTANFFTLSGSLGILGGINLLAATRSLKSLKLHDQQPPWDHRFLDG